MYPVSQRYKDAIKQLSREFNISINVVTKADQTFTLTDQNLKQGSTIFDSAVMSGDVLEIGSVISSSFECEIILDQTLKSIDFAEAVLTPTVTLILPANQTYPTPSSEAIPMGIFHVDSVNKGRKTTKLKALDNLSKLDEKYDKSNLTYPATLSQIYTDICEFLNVQEDPNFTTYNYTVPRKPKSGVTFRNVLSSLAEINGRFAKCDRFGKIIIEWLKPNSSIETHIDPHTRSKLKTDDFIQPITGVTMETMTNTYSGSGSRPGNVVDLSENLLIQSNQQAILNNFNNLGIYQTYVIPHKTSWSGDPALDTGDRISVTTIDNETFNTNITNNKHKYGGSSEASCGAQLKGSTNVIPSGSKNQSDVGAAVTAIAKAKGYDVSADGSGYIVTPISTEPPVYSEPWEYATNDDFSGTYMECDGRFRYRGSKQYVVLGRTILSLPVSSYRELFEGADVLGVASESINVYDMTAMFTGFGGPIGIDNIDLSRLKTYHCETMKYMFDNASCKNLDCGSFYTKGVTNMSGMFRNVTADTINVSGFDTSRVGDMSNMFESTRHYTVNAGLVLDLRSFDMSNVVKTDNMFLHSLAVNGYARTQNDADILNNTVGKPPDLWFTVN